MMDNATGAATAAEKIDLQEAFKGITGWDEIALGDRFGLALEELRTKPSMAMRAVVFLDLRHKGATDSDAYKAVMDMSFGEITDRLDMSKVTDEDGNPLSLTPGS